MKMKRPFSILHFSFFLCLLLLAAGCTSFRPTQTDAFIDDDGNIMTVEYGNASKPYTYKMVSPMNGAEIECKDTKMVRVRLPSKETIMCRICQNTSPKGTMYSTSDSKWKYLTVGLACRLYLRYPAENDYLLVYEGNVCPSALEGGGK